MTVLSSRWFWMQHTPGHLNIQLWCYSMKKTIRARQTTATWRGDSFTTCQQGWAWSKNHLWCHWVIIWLLFDYLTTSLKNVSAKKMTLYTQFRKILLYSPQVLQLTNKPSIKTKASGTDTCAAATSAQWRSFIFLYFHWVNR